MLDARTAIRNATLGAATIVLTIAVYPPVSEFFVELARERGWYEHPSQRLADMTVEIAAVAASPWFHWAGGLTLGFTAGVWLDTFLRRRHQPRTPEQIPPISYTSRTYRSPHERTIYPNGGKELFQTELDIFTNGILNNPTFKARIIGDVISAKLIIDGVESAYAPIGVYVKDGCTHVTAMARGVRFSDLSRVKLSLTSHELLGIIDLTVNGQ